MSDGWLQLIDALVRAPTPQALQETVVAGLVRHTEAQEAWLFLFDPAATEAQLAAHCRRDEVPAVGTESQVTAPLAQWRGAEGTGGWIRCLFRRPVVPSDVAGVTTAASVFDTLAAAHRA